MLNFYPKSYYLCIFFDTLVEKYYFYTYYLCINDCFSHIICVFFLFEFYFFLRKTLLNEFVIIITSAPVTQPG